MRTSRTGRSYNLPPKIDVTDCRTCGRFLTIGEALEGECSTCHPERFNERCSRCGGPRKAGMECARCKPQARGERSPKQHDAINLGDK